MEIKYMTMLRDNHAKYPGKEHEYKNEPINSPNDPMQGIEQLERDYNNGEKFPRALREYLFLAGDFCYIHEGNYGSFKEENDFIRAEVSRTGNSIPRPYFVFEANHSNSLIIYLDENNDDPVLYTLDFELVNINNYTPGGPNSYTLKIAKHGMTLTELVNHRINSQLEKNKKGW